MEDALVLVASEVTPAGMGTDVCVGRHAGFDLRMSQNSCYIGKVVQILLNHYLHYTPTV